MVRGTTSRAEVMGACVGFGEIEKNATLPAVELGEVSGDQGGEGRKRKGGDGGGARRWGGWMDGGGEVGGGG